VGASVAAIVGASVAAVVAASVAASVAGACVGAVVAGAPQAARMTEATIITTVIRYNFFMYFFSSLKLKLEFN
jgi:hypothetical protein